MFRQNSAILLRRSTNMTLPVQLLEEAKSLNLKTYEKCEMRRWNWCPSQCKGPHATERRVLVKADRYAGSSE